MPFVVEDGTGLATANSYVATATAITYIDDNHGTFHRYKDISTVESEQFLRRSTRWLDGRYRGRYVGDRASIGQGLEFPRLNIDVAWPQLDLEAATIEIAMRFEAGEDLDGDTDRLVSREKVDEIEVSYDTGSGHARYLIPTVEDILGRWLDSGGPMVVNIGRA